MDFLAVLRAESERFAELAATADPSRTVPSCPDWAIADLVWHLGEVQWFWAADIERRATDPASLESTKPSRPDSYDDLRSWGREQSAYLVDQLARTDDDVTVWTWSPPHQTVGFIRRHQVQEAAVHRWDLERAVLGANDDERPDPLDGASASDSIDEVLHVTLPWGVSVEKPLTGSVHLHCLDVEGEWFIDRVGAVERVHAKGNVALRGSASDLLLTLYRRLPLDAVEIIGDESVARDLLARIDTT